MVPRTSYKRAFDFLPVPFRVGIASALGVNNREDIFNNEDSNFGMTNLRVNFDLALLNHEDKAVNIFFDQFLSTGDVNSFNTSRDGISDFYGFQTGLRTQFDLSDSIFNSGPLKLFTELAYARHVNFDNIGFGFSDDIDDINAFIFSNELVLDTGTKVNPSLALLGEKFYGDIISFTRLVLSPGLIVPLGKDDNYQLRASVPFGLNEDSPDIGIQLSFFGLI